MTPIMQEIHGWLGTPFEMGERDCMLVLADWVKRVTGVDPCEDIRLTYDSKASCNRETGFFRDPVGTMAKFAAKAALDPTNSPRRGDVGLVIDPNAQAVGAICLGGHWAAKAPGGTTTFIPSQILAAWSVGYTE